MQVKVNGELTEVPAATTVAKLLETLKVDALQVAVELNESVVRRARHQDTALNDGDRLEIVTFVGGG
ncbi:MAG: sulfur carrier protein ThiS [Myxococcaceae bacterium]